MFLLRLTALTALVTICGCGNLGGGGSIHIPPDSIAAGEDVSLNLELSATGMGSGQLDTRYTKLICHYRTDNGAKAGTVMGTPKNVTDKNMDVEFVIPALETTGASTLKYWFTFEFDSVPNKRDGGVVPIEK